MHINDLLWIAGILEGEGCFRIRNTYPLITLKMTDEDTVSKYATLVGSSYSTERPRQDGWKTTYSVALVGSKASKLMKVVMPYMGFRRSLKIKEVLTKYEEYISNRKEYHEYAKSINFEEIFYKRNVLKMSYRAISRDYGVCHKTIIRHLEEKKMFNKKDCDDFDVTFLEEANMLYWVAGLLDGEGSFQKAAPSCKNQQKITISMTDEDVIAKLAEYLNCNYNSWQRLNKRRNDGGLYKKIYIINYKGRQSLELMKQLKPLMSARRQLQIQEALDDYDPLCLAKRHMGLEKFTYEEALHMKKLHDAGRSFRDIIAIYGGGSHNTARETVKKLKTRSKEDWVLQESIVNNK